MKQQVQKLRSSIDTIYAYLDTRDKHEFLERYEEKRLELMSIMNAVNSLLISMEKTRNGLQKTISSSSKKEILTKEYSILSLEMQKVLDMANKLKEIFDRHYKLRQQFLRYADKYLPILDDLQKKIEHVENYYDMVGIKLPQGINVKSQIKQQSQAYRLLNSLNLLILQNNNYHEKLSQQLGKDDSIEKYKKVKQYIQETFNNIDRINKSFPYNQ